MNVRPTAYFTNFTLTMLVVFYLQHDRGMLPTVGRLMELATDKDRYTTEDGVDVGFLHDVGGEEVKRALNRCYEDTSLSLEELLRGFFQFYAAMDFANTALCPISGTTGAKNER